SLNIQKSKATEPSPTTYRRPHTNDSGAGSLRQSLLDANANPGTDTIAFNIPGSGVKTVTLVSGLTALSEPIIIDGATQPGFTGLPLIELNGASAGSAVSGIFITAERVKSRA